MSIIIDQNTKLIVQGITGREGTFHTEQMLAYGTNVVAGVTPGKGGQTVLGVPVYNTVREAIEATGANTSVIFVPAKFTKASVLEALDAGLKTVLTIAEHVPVHDMMECYRLARLKGARLFGPNSFGIISPGKSKAGFMAHRIFSPGNVGVMSRSATNCYETVFMLSNNGIGQSTCIGVGGDMIPGSTFVDLLPDFNADPETKAIVIIGEIGGNEEELAAEYLKTHNVTKPVIAVIAGKNAPKGRSMGHAGAIVSADGTGSAESKEKALSEAGVYIAENTQHIVDICLKLKEEGKL
ncbi:MAG: succinate--CoA ligase subunit alpha [Clostridia bacterium]|nr:succinate--CoA ligase subunit alpha [Clostridia bacterium]